MRLFKAPDNSFAISIPTSFRVLMGTNLWNSKQFSYVPICGEIDVACFVYPADAYSGTNFVAAALAVKIIEKTDEKGCMAAPTENARFGPPLHNPVRWIGGFKWIHGRFTGAAAGTIYMEDKYRTWHAGKCWELSANLGETDADPKPAFTRSDEKHVEKRLDVILAGFRFLK